MAALDGDCPNDGRKANYGDWWREGWQRQWKVTTTTIMSFPASAPRGIQNNFPLYAGDLGPVERNALPLPLRKSAACPLTSGFPQRQLLHQWHNLQLDELLPKCNWTSTLGAHLRTWKKVPSQHHSEPMVWKIEEPVRSEDTLFSKKWSRSGQRSIWI